MSLLFLITNTINKCLKKKEWRGGLCPYLNLSCPAVSHIWSLTILLTTLMIFEPNSTPMVWFDSSLTRKQNKATQVWHTHWRYYSHPFSVLYFFHSSFEWGSLTSLIVKELQQCPGISKFSTLFTASCKKAYSQFPGETDVLLDFPHGWKEIRTRLLWGSLRGCVWLSEVSNNTA